MALAFFVLFSLVMLKVHSSSKKSLNSLVIALAVVTVWNALPDDVHAAPIFDSFRRKL